MAVHVIVLEPLADAMIEFKHTGKNMNIYIDQEHTKEEVDKSILEQLKEVKPWDKLDFSKKSIPKNKEDFCKQIMEIAEKIQRTIDERRRNEQNGILVGSNGQLLQLYGNATAHDWVVWYVKEFKK